MESSSQRFHLQVDPPGNLFKPLVVPKKTLMGPGPTNYSERVLRALSNHSLGHLHPELCQMMDDIKAGLQYAFQTKNTLTLAISATGHGGMEACFSNLVEPSDTVLIAKCGIWGERAVNMASRIGAHVVLLETNLGEAFTLEQLESALRKYRPAVVFVTHAESSTGLKQPLEGVGDLVHRYGGLLVVDAVASLGGEPFFTDAWGIDAVYTGSQKVLGAPPALTPITFSPLAAKKIFERKTKIPVYYWDMTILGKYWACFGEERVYHHTMCSTLVYGLREALAELAEEGLEACWARHAAAAVRLREGLKRQGLRLFVKDPRFQLSTITSVEIPDGINYRVVSNRAMEKYKVEIAGGLGPTVGKLFRIGLLGVNATPQRVDLFLRAFEDGLKYASKSNL